MGAIDKTKEQQLRALLSEFWKKVRPAPVTYDKSQLGTIFDHLRDQTEAYSTRVNTEATEYVPIFNNKLRNLLASDFNVKTIQYFSKLFLEEYNRLFMGAKEDNANVLNTEDIIRLANTATAIYLENWLANDTIHRTNVTAFSQRGFEKKAPAYSVIDKDAQKYLKLYRRYKAIQTEYQAQLKRENQPQKELPIRSQKGRGKPIELDYITMASLCAWNEEGFSLIKRYLLERFFIPDGRVYNQETHIVGYYHNASKNEALCKDLQNLYKYIDDFRKRYGNAHSEEKLAEYVAGCMAVYKLERSIHFDRYSRMVFRKMRNSPVVDAFSEFYWAMCTGRIPGLVGFLVGGQNGKLVDSADGVQFQNDYTIVGEPFDVLNHQNQINLYYGYCGPGFMIEGLREYIKRTALSDLLVMLHGAFPPEQMHSWRISDFRSAADFFAKDFKFLEKALEARAPQLESKDENEVARAHLYYDLLIHEMRGLYCEPEQPARQMVESQKKPNKAKQTKT